MHLQRLSVSHNLIMACIWIPHWLTERKAWENYSHFLDMLCLSNVTRGLLGDWVNNTGCIKWIFMLIPIKFISDFSLVLRVAEWTKYHGLLLFIVWKLSIICCYCLDQQCWFSMHFQYSACSLESAYLLCLASFLALQMVKIAWTRLIIFVKVWAVGEITWNE